MSRLLLNERPLIVLPGLVKLLGSIERAVVLQQIHWLLQQPNTGFVDEDGVRWVWGSYADWCASYFPMWSAHTLKKHMLWLERQGYIRSRQGVQDKWDRTKYYTVDYEAFARAEDAVPSSGPDVPLSNKPDPVSSSRPDVIPSNGDDPVPSSVPDPVPSNGPDVIRSMGPDVIPSNGPDPVRSIYRTETSTETTAEGYSLCEADGEAEGGEDPVAATAAGNVEVSGSGRDPKFAEFVADYEEVWGMMVPSAFVAARIQEWVDRVPRAVWRHALEEAMRANVRRWSYLERILERLEQDGLPGPVKSGGQFSEPVVVDIRVPEELLA